MLEKIIKKKREEIASLKLNRTLSQCLKDFSVIAEVKRRSPSAGHIGEIVDPVALAKEYVEGGAAAISVLTEKNFFGGSIEDLKAVVKAVDVPVLRKDFILDPIQLTESIQIGASAVLLIVAALKEQTKEMVQLALKIGLEPFVEVNTIDELEIALESGAQFIGVNNRNLKTFEVSLKTAEKLVPYFPKEIVRVAASGICTKEHALRMQDLGYNGILVGESLVKSENPQKLIQEMRSC